MEGLAEDVGLERCEEAEDEREENDILGLSRLSKEDEDALEEMAKLLGEDEDSDNEA